MPRPTPTRTASAEWGSSAAASSSTNVGAGELRHGATARNEKRVREVRRLERELAAAWPRPGYGETKRRSVRPESREKGFCIPRTRPVNREKQIKHTHLHATGLADDFWPISNTPYETESGDVKSDEVTTDVSQSVERRLTRSQAGSKQSPSSGSAHV
jgi:hypothetical protein